MDTSTLSRWIVEYATASDDWHGLLDGVCEALVDTGLPLWRVSLGTLTLDPSTRAFGLHWYMGQGSHSGSIPHGAEQEADYQRSPTQALAQRGERTRRWRLDALGEDGDIPLLHELRAQGGTDYVLHVFYLNPDTALNGCALSFTTQTPSGFTDAEIAVIDALRPVLGLALAKLNLSQTLREVLSVYVGGTTGARVLQG